MKNIIQLFFVVLILSLSSTTVNAQSDYLTPWPGATHTYTFADVDAGNITNWWVATSADGLSKANHGTEYTFVTAGYDAGDDQLEGTGVGTVQITWGAGVTPGTDYYVFLEVEDADGCMNLKAGKITIVNSAFNALALDVTTATGGAYGTIPAGDASLLASTCPDDVVNPVVNDGGYDLGSTQLVFRVERENSMNGWQFEYNITEDASQTFTVTDVTVKDEADATIVSQTNTKTGVVTGIGAANDYVVVYVTVTNQQDVTLDLNFDLLTAGGNTKDSANATDDGSSGDDRAEHQIKPMPVINGFSGS